MFWSRGVRPWSLAARLTLWYALTLAALLVGAIAVIVVVVTRDLDRDMTETVDTAAARIHAQRAVLLQTLSPADDDTGVRVIDPAGRTVFEGPILRNDLPPSTFPPVHGRREAVTSTGQQLTLFTRTFDGWTYHVCVNRSDEDRVLHMIYRNIALVAVPTLGLSLAVGYLLSRAGLRPLRRVARQMQAVSAERLDRRVSTAAFPPELADVAESFNLVMDRLAASVSRLDQFSADVAHELRTPVHNFRTSAELALRADRTADEYRQCLGGVVDEADRLARLIDRLLLLARLSDPKAGLVREAFDVAASLAHVRDFFEPSATEAGVEIEVAVPAGVCFPLDRSLFQRTVSNLIANALAHTPAGGRVALRATPSSAALVLEVADTGAGIAPDAVPNLFDRYYRPLGATGDGLGLGLAIVRRVVELHGGTVSATSRLGHGTTIQLTFPTPPRA